MKRRAGDESKPSLNTFSDGWVEWCTLSPEFYWKREYSSFQMIRGAFLVIWYFKYINYFFPSSKCHPSPAIIFRRSFHSKTEFSFCVESSFSSMEIRIYFLMGDVGERGGQLLLVYISVEGHNDQSETGNSHHLKLYMYTSGYKWLQCHITNSTPSGHCHPLIYPNNTK